MLLKRKKEPADRPGTVAGRLARGALSVVLAVSLCPTAAFADSDGLVAANAPLTSADSNTVSDVYSVGDNVVVNDSNLFFTVNNVEAKTVTVGGNKAHGALQTATNMESVDKCAGLVSIPADHKVVVPATVTDADGSTWTVSEIGTGAFMAVDKDNYISDVTIEAKLDKIGDFAFSGLGSSFWTPSFKFEMAGGASVKEIAASAFNFVHADEIDFPEGSTITLTTDKNYGTTNNRYCWTHTNIIGAKRIMLPLSYSGTVYQASCTQWLDQVQGRQNLASVGIPSPYASFICDGLANTNGTFTKAPTSFDVSTKHPSSVKVLLWEGSPAEQSFSSNSYLSAAEYYTVNHFAVLSDGVTLGVEAPEGQSAYAVPNANVKLNNVTDGVISGATEIPDGMLSVVNGDEAEWTLAEGVDYTVNYYASESATEALASVPATAGDYWVEFVGNDKTAWGKTGRYKLTLSESKTMLTGEDVTLTISEGGYTYDGTAKEPGVAVSHDGTSLTAGTDYTVAYSGNTDAGTATVTVTGIGSYAGAVTKTFDIAKVNLSSGSVTIQGGGEYYGGEWKPSVIVNAGGKEVAKTEYTVTYTDNINPGNGTATVTANESSVNYTGSNSATFPISKANLSLATTEDNITGTNTSGNTSITFDPVNGKVMGKSTYTGSAINPDVSALGLIYIVNSTPSGNVKVPITSSDYATEGWTNNTNVGEASITLTGAGNYQKSTTLKWAIEAKSLADDDVVVSGLDDQAWTGSAVTPPEPVVTWGERTLVKDTDYEVVYPEDLTSVGAKQVTITGKGNYTGSPAGTLFRIGKSLANAEVTVADAEKQVYTGSPLTPAVTVKLGEDTLALDQDYTVSYSDNTDAGTATVTITGAEDYTETVTKTFQIAKAEVAAPSAVAGLKYTGKAQTGVVVADGAGYTATGTTGTNAGPYTATLTADSNHVFADGKTTAEVAWSIDKAPSSISLAAQSKTYTSKALAYSGKVTKSGSTGAVTYKYYSNAACTKAATPKAAGTYYVKATVAANANYAAATSKAAKFTIAQAANPLAVKDASKTLKAKAVKKKAQSFTPSVVKTKGQGTLSYAKGKVSKKSGNFTVNKKTGKITVKKGTPKGTYTVQVKVTAAGNANYKTSAAKAAKVTVKVQ